MSSTTRWISPTIGSRRTIWVHSWIRMSRRASAPILPDNPSGRITAGLSTPTATGPAMRGETRIIGSSAIPRAARTWSGTRPSSTAAIGRADRRREPSSSIPRISRAPSTTTPSSQATTIAPARATDSLAGERVATGRELASPADGDLRSRRRRGRETRAEQDLSRIGRSDAGLPSPTARSVRAGLRAPEASPPPGRSGAGLPTPPRR